MVWQSRFQNPQRHLVTRFLNYGCTRKQIDHTLVRCRWVSSVIDEDAPPPEYEWGELKDTVADVS